MLSRKTLFIVGAGASHELGMPLGHELASQIAGLFRFKYDFGKLVQGDEDFIECFRRQFAPKVNEYLELGRQISAGIELVASIDNYIDTHRADRKVAEAGKTAIVYSILRAERKSLIRINPKLAPDRHIDFGAVKSSWLPAFASILQERVAREDISAVFANSTLLCFNYDRCIEHYLLHWLQAVYSVTISEAIQVLASLRILRPYGSVGRCWQGGSGPVVAFGATEWEADLGSLRSGIKTYSEQIEDEDLLAQIAEEMSEAEIVVFLGFGFHSQNMELLRPSKPMRARRVLASAFGIAEPNRKSIERELISLASHSITKRQPAPPEVFVRDQKAGDLLRDFRRDILAADL